MDNAWKVIWFESGVKKVRSTFEGNRPKESGAIDFAKKLVKRGIPLDQIHVVSKRKPFDKPEKVVVANGLMWCPYCLKPREFVERAIKFKEGNVGPSLWRCPVCTISTFDAAVRRNNRLMIIRFETRAERTPSEKTIRLRTATGR